MVVEEGGESLDDGVSSSTRKFKVARPSLIADSTHIQAELHPRSPGAFPGVEADQPEQAEHLPAKTSLPLDGRVGSVSGDIEE